MEWIFISIYTLIKDSYQTYNTDSYCYLPPFVILPWNWVLLNCEQDLTIAVKRVRCLEIQSHCIQRKKLNEKKGIEIRTTLWKIISINTRTQGVLPWNPIEQLLSHPLAQSLISFFWCDLMASVNVRNSVDFFRERKGHWNGVWIFCDLLLSIENIDSIAAWSNWRDL